MRPYAASLLVAPHLRTTVTGAQEPPFSASPLSFRLGSSTKSETRSPHGQWNGAIQTVRLVSQQTALLNAYEVSMGASGSTTLFEPLLLPRMEALRQFDREPRPGTRRAVQGPDTDKPFFETGIEPVRAAPTEISFGPFRLLPTQFLLLEGGQPVPLGSRALEILFVLLERPGELISKQELMARVWPNVFVESANLTVHISALRRRLRDGRDGNRFIINIPGRGYGFVASVAVVGRVEADGMRTAPRSAHNPEHRSLPVGRRWQVRR